MVNDDDRLRWRELRDAGEVSLPELPGSAEELIRAAEDVGQRAGLDILVRALAALDSGASHAALERWAEDPDPQLSAAAFRHLGGVPIPPWAERILTRFATSPGHPRRYESMLLLNALSLTRPLFAEALGDPDPGIRSAGYASHAIRGKLDTLARLADGLDDPSPEVRDYVTSLWLEVLVGSDVDGRGPLMERPWSADERPAVESLRQRLRVRFGQLLASASPETSEQVATAIRLLEG